MENQLIRLLLKTAAITTPIISLLLVTPIFLLIKVQNFSFVQVWLVITFAVALNWTVNLVLLIKSPWKWTKSWRRIFVISLLVFCFVQFGFQFTGIFIPVEPGLIAFLRLVNITAINSIIYVLIDSTQNREKRNQFELENNQLKLANLEAEYKLLKDQINPHFLFNALNTAKTLVRKDPGVAEQYIVLLSEFLRASIHNQQKTWSVKDELKVCSDFTELNHLRFGDALQVRFETEPTSQLRHVPCFSILSLVENAIKHNVATVQNPLLIVVGTDRQKVSVRNNRSPKNHSELPSQTGLANLNERYRLLTGNQIRIIENESMFSVELNLLEA